ncbi:MAG: tripartite tricarboxylate transporter TctB family protein [Bryobacterales bacterium]|nr:tripartite tricarboxylate transporter TctB family protein [Bryobacterales bacterium]
MIAGIVFLVFGVFLLTSSFVLPEGVGRVPGPGFFPRAIGAAMTLLAAAEIAAARKRTAESQEWVGVRMAAGALALLAVYLAAWNLVPFAVRTPLFLGALLRLAGERWRASLTVAVVLTALIFAAFRLGLRLPLD